ncbi:MAG: DUF2283 domain-containing protein [Actinomycetota bacterium]
MRYTYDSEVDVLTVDLHPGQLVARTVEVDDSRHADLNADGLAISLEFLAASIGFEIDDLIDRFSLWEQKSALQDLQHRDFKPTITA